MVQRRTSYWERIMLESRLSEMVIESVFIGRILKFFGGLKIDFENCCYIIFYVLFVEEEDRDFW